MQAKEFWNRLFGKLTVSQVKEWLKENPQTCFCGYSYKPSDLRGLNYPHPNGLKLAERKNKVWLYLHCPKCQFDLSWQHWKGR